MVNFSLYSTLDHDYLSPLVAITSPNINTLLDLSASKNHFKPSHLTSPHHIKGLFEIVVAVVVKSVFRLEMHQNDIFFSIFKNYF
jgi:hypothetical protein